MGKQLNIVGANFSVNRVPDNQIIWYVEECEHGLTRGLLTELTTNTVSGFSQNKTWNGETINLIRFKLGSAGRLTIAKANNAVIGGHSHTLSDQQVFTLDSSDVGNVITLELPTPITLTANDKLCFGVNGDTFQIYYSWGTVIDYNLLTNIKPSTSTNNIREYTTASLGIDVGYIS